LLQSHSFVILIAVDFSKAFDCLRHSALAEKLAKLNMPDNVHNWMVHFLNGHSHCTKYNGVTSAVETVNASIVQGSAIGPAAYIVASSDMYISSEANSLDKYADDAYIIIPANNADSRVVELDHIQQWAQVNNLKLNRGKTQEIVFTGPRGSRIPLATLPAPIPGIERVTSIKLLGVTLQSTLSMSAHVEGIMQSCSQTLFALRTLKAHGLPAIQAHTIFTSVALSKLTYAAPSWHGFASRQDIDRVEAFIRRSKKWGLCSPSTPTFKSLCADNDANLFSSIISCPSHTLYHLFEIKGACTYNLRPRAHPFVIPLLGSKLTESNFPTRILRKTH
jgi:hypothetical protein